MDLKGATIRDFYHLGSEQNLAEKTPKTFKVPHFQRPFTWGTERIEMLINDLFDHIKSEEHGQRDSYFAGAIVTVSNTKEHSLIDGQQRFTTIFLTNYVKYMLHRICFEVSIDTGDSQVHSLTGDFAETERYLFKEEKPDFENFLNSTMTKLSIKHLQKLDESERKKRKDKAKEEYRQKMGLPALTQDYDDYSIEHKKGLSKQIKNQTLLLTYDRKSFNRQLREALSIPIIKMSSSTGPELFIHQAENCPTLVELYLEAIRALFNAFKKQAEEVADQELWESDTVYRSVCIIKQITSFLEKLKFCVVQTGREQDAYTLFEVLNDRALALDDLDIIKNAFYRKYVLSNTTTDVEEAEEIDETIEALEELWGEQVFQESSRQFIKSFIAFSTVSFLTGDKSLKNERGLNFRNAVKTYLDSKNKYSSTDINDDFQAFRLTKVLLDGCVLEGKRKVDDAIAKIFSGSHSYTVKAITLVQAFKFDGVLPGIISPILNRAFTKPKEDREAWIKELFLHETAKKEYAQLEEFCYYLITLVLSTKSFKEARELVAMNIIPDAKAGKEFSLTKAHIQLASPLPQLKNFREWASSWQFKEKSIGYRIRILLLFLIQAQKADNELIINAPFSTSIPSPKDLNLDHLEPQTPDKTHSNSYFQDPNRLTYVNGLGNMMFIDSKSNIQKYNDPMESCFDALTKAGLGTHWLTVETKNFLDTHHTSPVPDVKVPTKEFFEKRSTRLVELMEAILKVDYGQSRITLPNS